MVYTDLNLKNDAQLKVRVPAWKRQEIKRIANIRGKSLNALLNAWLDAKLAENGVKAELRVINEQ